MIGLGWAGTGQGGLGWTKLGWDRAGRGGLEGTTLTGLVGRSVSQLGGGGRGERGIGVCVSDGMAWDGMEYGRQN